MYKNEMKNSYKNILDDQMNQQRMQKDIETQERASNAVVARQRFEMQRQQEAQMRQIKIQS